MGLVRKGLGGGKATEPPALAMHWMRPASGAPASSCSVLSLAARWRWKWCRLGEPVQREPVSLPGPSLGQGTRTEGRRVPAARPHGCARARTRTGLLVADQAQLKCNSQQGWVPWEPAGRVVRLRPAPPLPMGSWGQGLPSWRPGRGLVGMGRGRSHPANRSWVLLHPRSPVLALCDQGPSPPWPGAQRPGSLPPSLRLLEPGPQPGAEPHTCTELPFLPCRCGPPPLHRVARASRAWPGPAELP